MSEGSMCDMNVCAPVLVCICGCVGEAHSPELRKHPHPSHPRSLAIIVNALLKVSFPAARAFSPWPHGACPSFVLHSDFIPFPTESGVRSSCSSTSSCSAIPSRIPISVPHIQHTVVLAFCPVEHGKAAP
uniref:HDC09485 n=1 Tax=Drosophila melanogaster TaxID=7227 RepID=Q6ILG2_DROME|nr:TPA_inf: HDC09485 [Drosophila melanogaster]